MSDDPYVYSGTQVLRNKFDIRDEAALAHVERLLVTHQATKDIPTGAFDLAHLQRIHRHLYGRVYEWAGEIRTCDITRGESRFLPASRIDFGFLDIHKRLEKDQFLKGLDAAGFAQKASLLIGDVNYAHPFRDGNGRTQLHYLKQLAEAAGHPIDLSGLDKDAWLKASIRAHGADYGGLADEIRRIMEAPSPRNEIDHDR